MSKNNRHENETFVDDFIVLSETVTESTPIVVDGTVSNCVQLRVRETPDNSSDNEIGLLTLADGVLVNLTESTDDFYKITTAAGLEGYCMKQFINIKKED